MLMSISGTSGSGKTYSALLLASGIAGKNGTVGLIDAENGRGEMYADSPGIVKAMPSGYYYIRLDPPHSPERYTEAIQAAERAGITVCVIDSATHEWDGIGGCCEIADKNKLGGMPNWAKAKIAHKRFMNYCLSSKMHIIFCLRAQEKVRIFKKGDEIRLSPTDEQGKIAERDTIVPIGLQPITEKSCVYEMLISLLLDEKTHAAIPLKVPEPLMHLFPGRRLITKEDGENIRRWNDTGAAQSDGEQLRKRAMAAAEEGMAEYQRFFSTLSKAEKSSLTTVHSENKDIAQRVDRERLQIRDLDSIPDDAAAYDPKTFIRVEGVIYTNGEEMMGWKAVGQPV